MAATPAQSSKTLKKQFSESTAQPNSRGMWRKSASHENTRGKKKWNPAMAAEAAPEISKASDRDDVRI